jgi:hypothetical protein
MRFGILLLVMHLMGCASTQGLATTIPLADPNAFKNITRIKMRPATFEGIYENAPSQAGRSKWDTDMSPIDEYHPAAAKTAERVLREKGYSVSVVWENPFTYGPDRPCIGPKPGDETMLGTPPWYKECAEARGDGHHGLMVEMNSFAGTLANDEAFIELVTHSRSYTSTDTRLVATETEIGKVTDASGNTIGRIYEKGETSEQTTNTQRIAIASIQVFIPGQSKPIYHTQYFTENSDDLISPVERALAAIPSRK